jgi:hypothetical protein
MATKKKHDPLSVDPKLPVDLPVAESSTHAARIRIIRGLVAIAHATRYARAASSELGPTEPIDKMIRSAEDATRDALHRLELLDKKITKKESELPAGTARAATAPKGIGKNL